MTSEHFVVLVLFGMGLYFFIASIVRYLRDRHAVNTWTTTTAEIIRSGFIADLERDSDNKSSMMYTPDIVYQYTVDGVEHRGKRISQAWTSTSSRSWAEKVAAEYPRGRQIEVIHHPVKHHKSMRKGAEMRVWLLMIFAGIGLAMMIGACVWWTNR